MFGAHPLFKAILNYREDDESTRIKIQNIVSPEDSQPTDPSLDLTKIFDNKGRSPLHFAIKHCHPCPISLVKLLMSCGADIDQKSSKEKLGWTPLLAAATLGNLEVVQLLTNYGIEINQKDSHNETPLTLAMKHGRIKTAVYLMSQGAKVNHVDFLRAITHGCDLNFVQHLAGQNPEFLTAHYSNGMTALLCAARHGRLEVVQWLVQQNPNCLQDRDGVNVTCKNALFHAAMFGHVETVKYLALQGIDVNEQTTHETVLLAMLKKKKFTVVPTLLDLGAEVNVIDGNWDTPLMWAVRVHNLATVVMLVLKGAEVNVENRYGETPLILAVKNNNLAMVRFLVAHGAEVSYSSKRDHRAAVQYAPEGSPIANYLQSLPRWVLPAHVFYGPVGTAVPGVTPQQFVPDPTDEAVLDVTARSHAQRWTTNTFPKETENQMNCEL